MPMDKLTEVESTGSPAMTAQRAPRAQGASQRPCPVPRAKGRASRGRRRDVGRRRMLRLGSLVVPAHRVVVRVVRAVVRGGAPRARRSARAHEGPGGYVA